MGTYRLLRVLYQQQQTRHDYQDDDAEPPPPLPIAVAYHCPRDCVCWPVHGRRDDDDDDGRRSAAAAAAPVRCGCWPCARTCSLCRVVRASAGSCWLSIVIILCRRPMPVSDVPTNKRRSAGVRKTKRLHDNAVVNSVLFVVIISLWFLWLSRDRRARYCSYNNEPTTDGGGETSIRGALRNGPVSSESGGAVWYNAWWSRHGQSPTRVIVRRWLLSPHGSKLSCPPPEPLSPPPVTPSIPPPEPPKTVSAIRL